MARWSRSDQLGLESVLSVVVALGAVSVVPRVVAAVAGDPITLAVTLPEDLVRPAPGVEGPLTGSVVLAQPDAGQQLLALLPELFGLVLLAVGAALLLGVVRALRGGDPFTPSSARRLRWLAALVVGGGVGVQLVSDLSRNALVSEAGALASELGREFTLPLWPLLAGLLIAFVAEVFARGAALRADVEGLV